MKPYVCIKSDFANEVIDVLLVFTVQEIEFERWVQGFNEEQWEDAEFFAHELASVLIVEFVGDKTDE
jgi:hypothetical protein